MSNILETIVEAKKKEIEEKRLLFDPDWYKFFSTRFDRQCYSLKRNLQTDGSTGIIAEFKRKSPSKGWFKSEDYSAPAVVMSYEQQGAAAASVLTDKEFFGGDIEDLTVVRAVSQLPLLRKDFIIDEIQIHESKAYGADVILLIAAILSPARVIELAREAKNYGMEVLLELHGEDELGHICAETEIIGINNRDLKTFRVDIERSLRMARQIPVGKVKVAESGINSIENILLFRDNGFEGFLIGEHFMKQPDPTIAFAEFVKQLKAKAHED
ncbi:MAG TPA: indole-3-glycerol phosphate synthase TrpC [Chitinophagaceae bacterium]